MQIESTRFGTMEVRDDAVLQFPDGLIGLPGERWALVAQDESSPFYWLHSAEDAGVALPVTRPWLFFHGYEVRVSDDEARSIGLESPEGAEILCVVRATQRLEDFTINLAGPIVINTNQRLGRQIINETGGYSVRQPLFAEVELTDVPPEASRVPVAAAAT